MKPEYKATMQRLEEIKHVTSGGVEYWMAREVNPILGYPTWREFEHVIDRARNAFSNTEEDPSHHIVPTHKMVEIGSGAMRRSEDYFLSRGACYLIAINGDPSKPQIAAAQAYFAIQTRRMEEKDQVDHLSADEKRIELRDKVTKSVKMVSSVAHDAGVKRQGIFHDQRYQGLYGMSLKEVRAHKNLNEKENLLDRAGLLELSAHDFQMNLAADVIKKERVKGESRAIQTNLRVAKEVRDTIEKSGGTPLEKLPLEPPIKEVRKRVLGKQKQNAKEPSSN